MMKPNSIEWHEQQLKLAEEHHLHLRRVHQKAEVDLIKSHKEWKKYFKQIERAKRLGKTSFDRDRFWEGRDR